MLTTFFKIAWRNIFKNKVFSLINILGLAIGMASAMLIVLWIADEASYDRFHEKKDRIYEAWNRAHFSDELHCWNTTPKILGPTMEHDFPEVDRTCRVNWSRQYLLETGDKHLGVSGIAVDNSFLEIFTFPLLKGHPKTVLSEVNSIVVTEQLAKKLFGDDDPVGRQIRIDNKDLMTVSGVLKNLPTNTRFDFEYLYSWKFLEAHDGGVDDSWGNNSTRTYVLLKPDASLVSLQAKMKILKPRYAPDEPKWEMFIYPLERWRLHSSFEGGIEKGGKITLVYLFGVIAGFVLLIACINFMNLSTARSEKRAKEVGVRKVVGASKFSLIYQFIAESVLLAFIAGVIAVLLVQVVLPSFNDLAVKKLALDFTDASYWLSALAFVLVTGFLAGSYPAFFLSAFQPVKVLKGTFQPVKAVFTPRKVLVVVQFVFAISLIISTIIVRQQISHAQNRQAGYDRNNLVYTYIEGNTEPNYGLIKNELLSSGVAASVTKTSSPLTQGWSDSWGFEWKGKDPNDKTDFDRFCADESLSKTIGLTFVQGRDFNLKDFPTDSLGMIVNESALKVMKFKHPIGEIVKDNGHEWHIVGVIKDFILHSPYHPTRPMIIEGAKGWFNVIQVKLNPQKSTAENLARMEQIFKKYNPNYPFFSRFVDEEYAKKFAEEKRIGTLAGVFAGLTIFISCLGLFGLATYMAENRIKEIGIRKVLGASVSGIVQMLSKDFLLLVLISLLIACPLAWWGMHTWLQDYDYRIHISWMVFAAAGVLSLLIAFLTVSYQAIKAALANPVRSLRTE